MNKEEITTEDLAKHIQTMIDDMEQRMAAMVGMDLYKYIVETIKSAIV